jgi:tetratricopeptide (TPR) repeat protein
MPEPDKPAITLYMIGHAPDAECLERLLGQLKPILKELCFVVTDDKIDCEQVIADSGVQYQISKYAAKSRDQFDFAKARNQALKMAEVACNGQGWLMWLDCDDSIDNPERIIEQMQAHADGEAYGMPYIVSARSGNLWKLRIHKPGEWHWINPIHEELVPTQKKESRRVYVLKDCPVVHAPPEGKSNHDFHIGLLKKQSENAPNHYAYIGKELMNSQRHEDAKDWIRKTIAIHPVEMEVFNGWLNLGICEMTTGNDKAAEDAFHAAIRLRPWRREPYHHLAQIMGLRGGESLKNALAFAKACNAQPDFGEPAQDNEIYERDGLLLEAMLLEKFGKLEQAHFVLQKLITLDDKNVREITLRIEQAMKSQAIKERDAA